MFFDPRFLDLCDAELQSEDGETFRVHQIILAMECEYFRSMFCRMNENRRSQFRIPGIRGNCLREVLKYIYTGEVSDTEQNLDLMLAADYLYLRDLHLKVKQHLMKNMIVILRNCLSLLKTAYYANGEEIIRKILTFVERNFKEILLVQKNNFEELPPEVLGEILRSGNLNVCSETVVWLSIVEWTRKDISTRSQCVPQLLMCLARKELDENLAKEILQHELVCENIFMKDLNELKDSSDVTSHLDALLLFLGKHSSSTKPPLYNRLPSRLHVISHAYDAKISESGEELGTYNLYITYDETMDLWCKIGESVDCHVRFLTVVGHNIYIFGMNRCRKFDILTRKWMPMSSFRNQCECLWDLSVFEVDDCIYRIGRCSRMNCVVMEVYDTLNDRWFEGGTLSDMFFAKAVTLNKKIYVVGSSTKGNATKVFDTVTKIWENLPPLIVYRQDFGLVMYREKMYVLGGDRGSLEGPLTNDVFDPPSKTWEQFPLLPCTISPAQATVFNNRIAVYSSDAGPPTFCWNPVDEQWEEFEGSAAIDFRRLRFCTTNDEEVIRSATKLNRGPGVHLEKSLFG